MSTKQSAWRCSLFAALILFFTAAPAGAQKEEARVIDLGKITVMAPQPGVEITTEKTIIRMDEFKKPGDVRSLTDVLTEIGGVDVQRINPVMASPGDEVSIRGLNEGRMVIEIDGRRINHTGHMGRFIVDWSTLNLDDVERIEIIRGGHSVLHPFAIGGVINIVTKKGKKTDKLKPEVDLTGGYGEFDTFSAAGSIDGGAGRVVGYHLSAGAQESDGFLRNNFQETGNVNAHLSFFLPRDAVLTLGAKYSEVDYGFPVVNDPARADFDPGFPVVKQSADQLRHLGGVQLPGGPDQIPMWEKHTVYLDGILEVPIGPGTFNAHAFGQKGRRWTSYFSNNTFIKDQQSNDETRGYIFEYHDVRLGDSNLLTMGAEYQELGDPPSNDIIYQVWSGYVQDVISLGDRWRVTPGFRYYHVDMDTYYSWLDRGLAAPAWPVGGKEQEDDGVYPSLKVDFQAAEDTALYAAVSRSYRLPCP